MDLVRSVSFALAAAFAGVPTWAAQHDPQQARQPAGAASAPGAKTMPGKAGPDVARMDTASVAASAEPKIRIERNQDAIQINASLRVDAHHHIAWQVLTDYNNLARFVPGMQTSQIVSGPGEPLLLKQTGQSGFLLISLPIEVLVQITEAPIEAIRFHGVGGNFKNKHGEWRIERQGDATLLIYQANIVPGFWVPPLIGPTVMGQDVRSKLMGLAQEMQRRAAFAEAGQATQR